MEVAMLSAAGIGTVLQILMVVVGHFAPALQQAGLFPIGGTLIGAVTGWLAGRATPGGTGAKAGSGAAAGGIAGVLGSLVSTALGDVPLGNIAIAGGSTLVTGAIGAALSALGKR
jgi:hypothetical protein